VYLNQFRILYYSMHFVSYFIHNYLIKLEQKINMKFYAFRFYRFLFWCLFISLKLTFVWLQCINSSCCHYAYRLIMNFKVPQAVLRSNLSIVSIFRQIDWISHRTIK